MTNDQATPVVLTIAGSDSGGGAGIQADLKTFSALNVFGTSAITCVTAQNPEKIAGIKPIAPEMVSLQIKTVCEGFFVAAVKTGMLYSASIIRAVSRTLIDCGISTLVVDPVMTATCGARLLQENAVETLCSELLPKATIITPNIPEAEILCRHTIASVDEMKRAAREIGEKFGTACVVKGGHPGIADCHVGPAGQVAACRRRRRGGLRIATSALRAKWPLAGGGDAAELGTQNSELGTRNSEVVDVLFADGRIRLFSLPMVNAVKTHGTGCVFSAALTAFLGRGELLEVAVEQAKIFVANTLKNAVYT